MLNLPNPYVAQTQKSWSKHMEKWNIFLAKIFYDHKALS